MSLVDALFHFLHLVAAIFWIGGIAYILLVLMPAVPHIALRDRSRFMPIVLMRFLVVVWVAVGVLLMTGMYRTARVWDVAQPGFFSTAPGMILMVKLLLVAGLVSIAARVTWWLVPNAKAHVSTHFDNPPDAYRCPQCGDIMGRMRRTLFAALWVALAIVFAAVRLRS